MIASRLGFALVVAALALGGRTAYAQAGPVSYWIPGWPLGFGGSLATAQGANTYGNFPSFDVSDERGGFSYSRYNFSNGFFVGSERGSMGFNGFSQNPVFGSLNAQGMQFGYNFKGANGMPVTFFGGVDSLKYDTGLGSPFAAYGMSGTTGYSAHAGVAFQPASNLSLSLGFGYTQQSGRLDSDTPSPSLSNTSQFDLVGGRH